MWRYTNINMDLFWQDTYGGRGMYMRHTPFRQLPPFLRLQVSPKVFIIRVGMYKLDRSSIQPRTYLCTPKKSSVRCVGGVPFVCIKSRVGYTVITIYRCLQNQKTVLVFTKIIVKLKIICKTLNSGFHENWNSKVWSKKYIYNSIRYFLSRKDVLQFSSHYKLIQAPHQNKNTIH